MAVLDEIVKWAVSELPPWQSDAVRRLLHQNALTQQDERDFFLMVKDAHNLLGPDELRARARPLDPASVPGTSQISEKVVLLAMKDLSHVNAIPTGAELTFGPEGLTVVYGDNASGKSGYARVLKKACKARDTTECIHPNVYEEPSGKRATASFVVRNSGREGAPLPWVDGEDAPDVLANICVFDSKCARVIIDEENEVAYLPYGGTVFQGLTDLLRSLRKSLEDERPHLMPIEAQDVPAITLAGRFLASLNIHTTIEGVEDATKWTEEDGMRLGCLLKEIAAATADDPRQRAQRLRNLKVRIEEVKSALERIAKIVSSENAATLRNQISIFKTCERAFLIAQMQNWSPKDEPLTGVGGDEWRMLYEAARNYSISVAYQDKPFPNVEAGALCVYCMQPLSSEAKERLARFQSFMEQAAKRNMDSATAALKTSLKNLSDIDPDIGVTNSHKDALDEIRARDKACADNIEEYVQVALVAYSIMQSAALQRTDVSLPSIQVRPAEAIDRIAQDMEAEALRLEKVAEPSGLASLKSEKEELVARKGLNGLKSQLIQRLADLKRIAAYELCIREMDTTQITKKGRQIISAALTREFENLINKELRAFGTHIRLRLQPKGSAGETIHKLVLDGCVLPQRARVTEILSEGEQRIVSIASFLAELKACGRGNPIVFDDPVSSLDHNWRERVAKRLTEESGHRQVIVFTHDITFAAWLMQAAQDGKTLMTMRCIQRIGEKPGNASEEIPWKAAGVRESINALEQEWRRISKAWKSLEQNKYEGCARVLYSRMRATWEKVIEEVAFVGSVHRFESHIRVNPELLKVTVVDSADWKILLSAHKKCCDITEAHDNIGSCNAPVPNPDEIGADLETLQGWIKRIREKQKTLN